MIFACNYEGTNSYNLRLKIPESPSLVWINVVACAVTFFFIFSYWFFMKFFSKGKQIPTIDSMIKKVSKVFFIIFLPSNQNNFFLNLQLSLYASSTLDDTPMYRDLRGMDTNFCLLHIQQHTFRLSDHTHYSRDHFDF